MEESNGLKQILIKDLPNSKTKHNYKGIHQLNDVPKDILNQIPEEYFNNTVYIVENKGNTDTGSELIKILNERFIFKQLNLTLQLTDKRELFYIIRRALGGSLDISGDEKQQARSIDNMIKEYCKKIKDYQSFIYWGYALDYLNIIPKETVIVFDTNMKTTMLSNENFEIFTKTPFFLIICEKKETIRATMEEMINRGYTQGYYGLALGGLSTTFNIKLLIELSKVRNFYAFIMHDLDLDGLKIFFNMKKWFNCESIGINPEMLAFCGIKFEDGCENYKPKTKEKTIKHLNKVIENYPNKKEKYESWISICENKRFELNSLTALRLKENANISKARDFANYLITKIEELNRKWNLIRLRKPNLETPICYNISVSEPSIIEDIEEEISDDINDINNKLDEIIEMIEESKGEISQKAYENLNNYLKEKELQYSSDWKKLIEKNIEKMDSTNNIIQKILSYVGKIKWRRILKELKRYKGNEVIKRAGYIIQEKESNLYQITREQNETLNNMLKKQERICERLIKKTPEYKEIKEELTKNREDYIFTNVTDLISEIQDDLREKIDDL